jgi:NADH:ubiquinone oxidoreductase subunit 2 (subunit N)
MLFFDYFFNNFLVYEYGLSLIFFNIFVYIFCLCAIFSFFFLFNLKNLRTLNNFKNFGSFFYFTSSVVLILLSLAGMPPLLGFTGKFFIFLFLLLKHQYVIFIFFSILSIFAIYFYIQNVRFIISKSASNIFLIKRFRSWLDFKIILVTIILNFFNIFGIFFIEDILIVINFWSSFVYLG